MPSPTIILAIALGLSLLGNIGLGKWLISTKQEVARVQQAYDSFVAQVKVEGERSEAEAEARTAAELKSKEKADAENAKSAAAVAATISELRHQRDSSRRAFLSSTPPGSKCPDGQTCFDRAEYQRAYGGAVKGLRGLADEGTAVTTDLNTAKKWAIVR